MAEKLIVIGGTAAGLSAASKAKRLTPSLEIEVYERSGYISYGACGLPYYVGDIIKDADELISVTADVMRDKRGIPTFIHHEVTAIDRENKTVTVRNLDTGDEFVRAYDKLVIATGASPVRLSIPGADLSGVHYLRNVEDGIGLKGAVAAGKHAVIIGGGFIGLELAEELTNTGVKVHLLEAMDRLLPFLDERFSEQVKTTLEQNGVCVHLSAKAEQLLGENGAVCGVKLEDGETLEADLVVVSIGVRPESKLATAAGLETGLRGGIVVDEHQQTSDPCIWACGDCVQMKHLITGKPAYVPLGTTANKQGRTAGAALAGASDTFKGILGSSVTKVFDLYIAVTGLSLAQARENGFAAASSIITKADRASYYPGGGDNTICMVLDETTGRLLGAQAIGTSTVAGRMNVFVAAITAGMTVEEINDLDFVYAPPVAPVYDPILIAASQAMKKVKKH